MAEHHAVPGSGPSPGPRPRPGTAPASLAPLLVLALLVATGPGCASTPESDGVTTLPAPTWRRGAAASLAPELGLTSRVDAGVGTLVLEGEAGRIVLVDATRAAVVAGDRLMLSETIHLQDGDVDLHPRDVVALSRAWERALQRHAAHRRDVADVPPSPRPAPAPPQPAATVSDPAWRVPLGREWEGILVHHSATPNGNMEQFDRYHREVNGWLMIGYHFVICNGDGGPDGLIQTTPRWTRQLHGAHAGQGLKRYNDHWVGICLVGDFSRERPTDKQLASLRRLVRYLEERCNIPATNVKGHRDVRQTSCPGDHFPLGELPGGLAPRAR